MRSLKSSKIIFIVSKLSIAFTKIFSDIYRFFHIQYMKTTQIYQSRGSLINKTLQSKMYSRKKSTLKTSQSTTSFHNKFRLKSPLRHRMQHCRRVQWPTTQAQEFESARQGESPASKVDTSKMPAKFDSQQHISPELFNM